MKKQSFYNYFIQKYENNLLLEIVNNCEMVLILYSSFSIKRQFNNKVK